MPRLLWIDASARPGRSDQAAHGSHTRRLTARFVGRWRAARPSDGIVHRDVGQSPPGPVTGRWIHAAFTPPDQREDWMDEVLAESDGLVNEVIAADIVAAGVPMYNFGVPAQFRAYVDNVVRVGRTFGFDRSRAVRSQCACKADAARAEQQMARYGAVHPSCRKVPSRSLR